MFARAEAKKQFRPYFDNAPVYGHGFPGGVHAGHAADVGTPEQVIERTLGFADLRAVVHAVVVTTDRVADFADLLRGHSG